MNIRTISRLEDLATLEPVWNALSEGVPFRSFAWLTTWWKCFGERNETRRGATAELFVLAVHNPATDQIVAIVPWFIERTSTQGHVIRWLGSGIVCSDYVSVLRHAGHDRAIAVALAQWLCSSEAPAWDALELSGVTADDHLLEQLVEELSQRKAQAHRRPGPTCWRLELPESWDDYLKLLSKTRRKRVRGIIRDWFDSGRAELVTLTESAELPDWLATFEDLHQRRRRSLGQPGCFASPPFARFLREVTPQLFESGQFQLNQLRIDGRPVAMDFNLLSDGDDAMVYAYQGGVDPDALDDQPGHLITIAQLRLALDGGLDGGLEGGLVAYDFLRGDEPYKHNWRATPTELFDYRIVPDRTRARLVHTVWASGQQARSWARATVHAARSLRDQALSAMRGLTRQTRPT